MPFVSISDHCNNNNTLLGAEKWELSNLIIPSVFISKKSPQQGLGFCECSSFQKKSVQFFPLIYQLLG
jgi:hypothetical protein